MKKISLLTAFIAGAISMSLAQGQGGGQQRTPEERVKMNIERMKTNIPTLSAEQEAKLTTAMLAQNKSQDSLSTAINTKIVNTLTEDQKKAYSAYVAQRGNRGFGGGFGGGPRGAGGPNGATQPTPEERAKSSLERLKSAASLTLTADQDAKLLSIITDQNKAQNALSTANSAKMMAILTLEQQKAYATMLEQRRQGGQGGGAPRPAGQ